MLDVRQVNGTWLEAHICKTIYCLLFYCGTFFVFLKEKNKLDLIDFSDGDSCRVIAWLHVTPLARIFHLELIKTILIV
jgi:hypothetical protein